MPILQKPGTVVPGPCNPACTSLVEFMADEDLAGSGELHSGYKSINRFRYINIMVRFRQKESDQTGVGLAIVFAFDAKGHMASGHYVNLEENCSAPQSPNLIHISGGNAWLNIEERYYSYLVRLPVMGPFVEVIAHNGGKIGKSVTVQGYLVS